MKYIRSGPKQIKNLEYYRHDHNMGMDENFKTAYSHCKTKYCWLLGNHRMISFQEMKELLDEVEQEKYNAWIMKTRDEITTLQKSIQM